MYEAEMQTLTALTPIQQAPCSEGRDDRLTAAVIVLWSDTAADGAPVALKAVT